MILKTRESTTSYLDVLINFITASESGKAKFKNSKSHSTYTHGSHVDRPARDKAFSKRTQPPFLLLRATLGRGREAQAELVHMGVREIC